MSYQKFGEESSSSDSHNKFKSLQLNRELVEGKRILDIGCNEGYFAFKMSELGALEVVGIDKTQKWIELANKRNTFTNVSFINSDLSYLKKLHNNSFDIVLTLSAMHYMSNPEMRNAEDIPVMLLDINRILSNNGLWIFEGGVVQDDTKNEFIMLKRSIGDTVYHPTKGKIIDIIEKTFGTCKYIGPSVNQKGDPAPRFVYYGVK